MGCRFLQSQSYLDFSKRLHSKRERIPIDGSFDLTYRCNLNCVHCLRPGEIHSENELNFKEISHILDEISDAGCLWLLLTGGEPLARKDFVEIYLYAKKRGFLITLFTNGTLINEELANLLRDYPPFSVEITLYGATKNTYEKVTRVPGSYEKCVEGIKQLINRKIPLKLKTMVLTINKHELWEIKKFANNLNLGFRFDSILNPCLDGSKTPYQYRLTPEEVVILDIADNDRYQEWQEITINPWKPSGSDFIFVCSAGDNSFHVNPSGNLSICQLVNFLNIDLRRKRFSEGWEKIFPGIKSRKSKSKYKCRKCDKIAFCAQCPGWAYIENKIEEMPVEYLCEIASLRATAFTKELSYG